MRRNAAVSRVHARRYAGLSDTAQRFAVGVNYWPRRNAMSMWRDFDPGEIAEDFARIAHLGLDGIRFFVRWDEFQPSAGGLDDEMLDRLETFVTLANDAGLHTIPALFCGHVGGANFLPAWTLDRTTKARYPSVTFDRRSNDGAANIYADFLREPQRTFVRTIGERLREHPAVRAWDLGNAFSRVREPVHAKVSTGEHSSEPAGEREMAAWSATLSRELREASGVPVTAGTSFDDLARDTDVRLGTLCAPFAFASIAGLNVELPFIRQRLDPEATPLLAAIAAAFSHKPVLVSGFGIPSCPPGKFSAFEWFTKPGEPAYLDIAPDDSAFATYPCASDAETGAFATAVLERLHADGRLGAYWWSWADYPDEVRARLPFAMPAHEAASGLIRADGSEKPVAAALSAFARQCRPVVAANEMPMIAAAYYYRTLPKSARTLFESWLRFVSERRA